MLIDIHTHIQQHDPSEVDGMLQRAAKAGVSTIIAAGTTVEDSRKAIRLAETYPDVYAGVGIHPSDIEAPISVEDVAALDDLASHERVVVMSETGIDHMPHSPDHRWQAEAFAAQIEIAKRHRLPVVFHGSRTPRRLDTYRGSGHRPIYLGRAGCGPNRRRRALLPRRLPICAPDP